MKIYRIAVLGLMATALTTGTTFAQDDAEKKDDGEKRGERARGERPDPAARFAAMDTDSSGDISRKEFKAAHTKRMAEMKERRGDRPLPEGRTPPTAKEVFKRLDKDGDGVLTKEEMKSAARGQRGMRGQGRPGGEGGQRGPGGPGGPGGPDA